MKILVKPYAAVVRELLSSTIFDYTGALQYFLIPENCISVLLKVWSGGGGTGGNNQHGGTSAFVSGFLSVTPGDLLAIYVGHKGVNSGGDAYVAGQGGGSSAILWEGQLIAAAGAGAGANNNIYIGGNPNVISKNGRLMDTVSVALTSDGLAGYNACSAAGEFGFGKGGPGGVRCEPYGYGVGGGGGGGYLGGGGGNGGISYYEPLFNVVAEPGGALPGGSLDVDKAALIGTEGQPGQVVIKCFA